MTSLAGNVTPLILMMSGVLILAGCFMETTLNIAILAPIMLLAINLQSTGPLPPLSLQPLQPDRGTRAFLL